MNRWEYRTLTLEGPSGGLPLGARDYPESLEQALNLLGDEGWELVQVLLPSQIVGMGGEAVALFKRPVDP